jgi:hypothetical protein
MRNKGIYHEKQADADLMSFLDPLPPHFYLEVQSQIEWQQFTFHFVGQKQA